jgi:hypothetical protein
VGKPEGKRPLGRPRRRWVEIETEERKWLKQQSEYIYAAGFDALLKQWGKCSNVVEGYIEK